MWVRAGVCVRRNIVSVRGIGAADLGSLESVRSSMYVVMEVLEGGTLKDMVLRQMTSRCVLGGGSGLHHAACCRGGTGCERTTPTIRGC